MSFRTVLTIHLGTENFPSNPILDAGIRETLAARTDLLIAYFAEYLESESFPNEDAALALSDYIRRKYHGHKIDVVIAVTETALRFVLNYRRELFPHAAIVFAGVAAPDEGVRRAVGALTGIKLGIAHSQTLGLALTLHPSTQRVFIVAKSTDERTRALVHAGLRDVSQSVELIYLEEETVPQLLAAVKAIPAGSLILFVFFGQARPGPVVYSDEIARLVALSAPVPVYGTSDFYIGTGVVGGVVRDTRETGTRLGEMALQILTGTRPQDIPIEAARVVPIVDWRQLRRWGVSESRVPAGALIRFREPSFWERYRVYALAALVAFLAQTALIGALLIQQAKRRQAEEQVRTSYHRIRDLGARLLNAQETERARIARELHDDISQQLALLAVDLELLRAGFQGEGEEAVGEALNRARDITKSVHDLSHRLHPAKLRLIGLVAALNGLQRELSQPGLTIAFTHEHVPP